jgi:hypothetical protein
MSRHGEKLELDTSGVALCPATGEHYRLSEGKLALEPTEE